MAGAQDEATERLIQEALREEEAERKRQKQQKHAEDKQRKAARKGMTLEQIEAEEGGPVKESQVGMAQTKRAAKRKGTGDDTDLPEDVEDAEEDLELEEEDGMKLEAFNLKEERERGFFDDAGNYVEREDKDAAEEAKDAWLQSDESKVVSEAVRRKIEERQRALEAAEAAAGPVTATQIARLQYQAAQALLPGESVAAGLKRLGGHSRRPAAKRSKPEPAGAEAAPPPADAEETRRRFNSLTEAAMKLMDAGENDVYSQKKEYFLRAAAVYIDVDEEGSGGGGKGVLAAGAGKAAYEDADEDMFGSDEEKEPKQAAAQPAPAAAPAAPAAGPPAAAAPAKAAAQDETDYSSWPVKELRRFLSERGADGAGIVEKEELIAKVKAVAAAGPEGEAPAGYSYDAATGYWHSAETGMYWDASSGGFFNSTDGKWYSWDAAAAQFVAWPQQPAGAGAQ